ncbi:serine/threonine-protein kinase MPS1-like, partial [Telopea speciosissima]|uniref:serine/threonine-protein kinase MPS1-like n=1 Tax=Telopea speciosissima TaxID=54955 RepID=UPI001CC4EE30
MDREANLQAPPATSQNPSRLSRPFSSSSSYNSSSSSTPDLVRHVQAALKRHRPLSTMQSESLRPRRVLVPQREPSKGSEKSQVAVSLTQANAACELINQRESVVTVAGEVPDDSSITPPLVLGTSTKIHDQNSKPFSVKGEKSKPDLDANRRNDDAVSSSCVVSQHLPAVDGLKGSNVDSQRADERMATIGDNLSSHLSSLALTEMECDGSNRVDTSSVNDHGLKPRDFQQPEILDISFRSDGGISSLMVKRNALYQDQQHQLMTFIGKDISYPMTQSSVVGSTCATTTSVHSSSAPMLNSATYSSCHRDSGSHMDIEPLEEFKVKPQPIAQGNAVQPCSTFQCNSGMVAEQTANLSQASVSAFHTSLVVNDHGLLKGQQDCNVKEDEQPHDAHVGHGKGSQFDDKPTKGKEFQGDGPDVISQVSLTRNSSTNVKLEPSKSEKPEKPEKPEKAVSGKGASVRKKNYDADLFFKVNGKLYQKLGKIGSGGSSEVYKVISSDCTIYALKRIKLKGRDYSTAYGFCQEI